MSKFNQYVDADANYKTINDYFNPNGGGATIKCNYFLKGDGNVNLSFWWDSKARFYLSESIRENLGRYLAKATTHHLNDILCTAIQYAYDDRNKALAESKNEAKAILEYIKEQEKQIYGK